MRARTPGRGWIATGGCTVLVLSAACVGNIGEHGQGGPADGTIPTLGVDADTIAASGLRRLTASEYYNTLVDLLHDDQLPVFELAPTDARSPFDNDYSSQVASQGLIDAADFIAEKAADRLVADLIRRDQIVGCVPADAGDEDCLRSFVTTFGRRALRHTLTAEEIDAYVAGLDGDEGALGY